MQRDGLIRSNLGGPLWNCEQAGNDARPKLPAESAREDHNLKEAACYPETTKIKIRRVLSSDSKI